MDFLSRGVELTPLIPEQQWQKQPLLIAFVERDIFYCRELAESEMVVEVEQWTDNRR